MDGVSIIAQNGVFVAKVKNTKRIHLPFVTVVPRHMVIISYQKLFFWYSSTQKTFIPTNIFEFILGNSWYYNSANSPYRAYSGLSYEKQQFKVASTPKYDDFNDYY